MFIPYLFAILSFVAMHGAIVWSVSARHRVFLSILLLCHVYFCVLGYLYWVGYMGTEFVGLIWGRELVGLAAFAMSASTLTIAAIVWIVDRLWPQPAPLVRAPDVEQLYRTSLIADGLFLLGLVAGLVVIMGGQDAAEDARAGQAGVFLIAFQIADLMIPALLFTTALKGFTPQNLGKIAIFLGYAVFTGLRYKIALCLIPLVVFGLTRITTWKGRVTLAAAVGIGALSMFTIMTVFRSKFAGLDFTQAASFDVLFGLFAEANVLFGLSAIIKAFVDQGVYYPTDPIVDSLYGLVPRILMPERGTSDYILVQSSSLLTFEGKNSGTAYPFIGEYAMMLGWTGVIIGVLIYPFVYLALRRLIDRAAATPHVLAVGVGLIGAFLGYYNYSRGYLPQITKGYIFVLAPYFLLAFFSMPKRVETIMPLRR